MIRHDIFTPHIWHTEEGFANSTNDQLSLPLEFKQGSHDPEAME